MKKTLTSILALSTLSLAAFFTSCNDVIFYEINNEVKLEDATVSGDVTSLVRCTGDFGDGSREYLFVSNGNIYYKDVEDASKGSPTTEAPATGYNGNWTKMTAPAPKIHKLASDSTCLYALSTPVEENDDSGDNEETGRALYCYDFSSGEWSEAISVNDSQTISTSSNLFGTNDVNPANRKAYLTIGSVVYELSGSSAISTASTPTDYTGAEVSSPLTAAWFNGGVVFSPAYALVTNARYNKTDSSYTDATVLYWSSSDDLHWYNLDDDSTDSIDGSAGYIYAIAPTADYILLGTSAGASRVNHEGDWIPDSSTSDFDTNASSTLSTSYYVWTFIAIDPAQTETGGDLYASTDFTGTSASFSNRVLWGYYPGRGSWNCE